VESRVSAENNVPRRIPVDVYVEAGLSAELERERDLMTLLVEAAQFKSAARAWHRHRALDSGKPPSCRALHLRGSPFAGATRNARRLA
jgi:hypothetical protein